MGLWSGRHKAASMGEPGEEQAGTSQNIPFIDQASHAMLDQ